MNKFTEFGVSVKCELIKRGMKQQELERLVAEDTGKYVDHSYIYKILTGKRKATAIVSSICKVLSIGELHKERS